jgi:hypothetical protein
MSYYGQPKISQSIVILPRIIVIKLVVVIYTNNIYKYNYNIYLNRMCIRRISSAFIFNTEVGRVFSSCSHMRLFII